MLSKAQYLLAYKLLENTTPLSTDCGELCGKKCCTDWQDDVGIYLLPGEEQLFSFTEDWLKWEKHSTEEYEFCPSWEGDFFFVKCIKPCPREKRPFQCRTFPLLPHLEIDGRLSMILAQEFANLCPLIQKGIKSLNPDFVKNAKQAWQILLNDPLIYADVLWESEKRRKQK